jgi:hypothetical protein
MQEAPVGQRRIQLGDSQSDSLAKCRRGLLVFEGEDLAFEPGLEVSDLGLRLLNSSVVW